MNWLDGLTSTDKVPKGFYTSRAIAKMRGLSRRRTSELLQDAIDRGEVINRKIRTDGKLQSYYGPAK